MDNNRKNKLIELGPEVLSQALLDLENNYFGINDIIDRLISSPEINVQRFKNKLSQLQNFTPIYDWDDIQDFITNLKQLLESLKQDIKDPIIGMQLVIEFFKAENSVLEITENSCDAVRDVYTINAHELFIYYANLCSNKNIIEQNIIDSIIDFACISIDAIVDCSVKCLTTASLKKIIKTIKDLANSTNEDYVKTRYLRAIASLAKQMDDAKLYEQTKIELGEKDHLFFFFEVAQVYASSKNYEMALDRLTKYSAIDSSSKEKKEDLLIEIYSNLGDIENLTNFQYKKFNKNPSLTTLNNLLDTVGKDKREKIINDKINESIENEALNMEDINFMLSLNEYDKAEINILKKTKKLRFHGNWELLPIAKLLETNNKPLSTSLIYRSLLNYILSRKVTSDYDDGAIYLKKLIHLNNEISDWKNFPSHKEYFEQFKNDHYRKRKFWGEFKKLENS